VPETPWPLDVFVFGMVGILAKRANAVKWIFLRGHARRPDSPAAGLAGSVKAARAGSRPEVVRAMPQTRIAFADTNWLFSLYYQTRDRSAIAPRRTAHGFGELGVATERGFPK